MVAALALAVVLSDAAFAQLPAAQRPGPQCVGAISDEEASEIGRKIWMQEGSGKLLIWWDDTSDCPSLGINNYLWFQAGHVVPFEESFPPLIDFMLSQGADVPEWMRSKPPAPWTTPADMFREVVTLERVRNNPPGKWGMTTEMFATVDSPRAKELKEFLARTVPLQARFSIQRMIGSLPKMLAAVPESARASVETQFNRVSCSRGGLFALVDYVNFKGEGVNPKERYESPGGEMQGWGLLQILLHMKGSNPGPKALNEFADSAEWVLNRRVDNAPPERRDDDRRWLQGWVRRIQGYRGG